MTPDEREQWHVSDRLVGLAVLALRPFEIYHSWRYRRAYARGRYRRGVS